MAGFLSNQIITNAQALLQQLHETFAVDDIVVYQKARRAISAESSNYNFIYNNSLNDDNIDYTPVTGVYKARILFPAKQETAQFGFKQDKRAEDQVNARLKEGIIRITVDPTGAAAVRTCERIIYKDKTYQVEGEEVPRGWQQDQTFQFYLKVLN